MCVFPCKRGSGQLNRLFSDSTYIGEDVIRWNDVDASPIVPENEVVTSASGDEVRDGLPLALPWRNLGWNVSLDHFLPDSAKESHSERFNAEEGLMRSNSAPQARYLAIQRDQRRVHRVPLRIKSNYI